MSLFANIQGRFNFPAELIAVECSFLSSGTYYSLSHLKVNKSEVELISSENGNELNELMQHVDSKLPLFLLLSGKKILSKNTSYSGDLDTDSLIRNAYPNIDLEEVVYQAHLLDDTSINLSLTRLNFIDEILENFQRLGLRIIDLQLGIQPIKSLLKAQKVKNPVQLGRYNLDLNNDQLEELNQAASGEINLFGEHVSREIGLSYLYGLKQLSAKQFMAGHTLVKFNRKDWKFQQYFKSGLVTAASVLFIALLLSFMMWSNYDSKNQALATTTISYDEQLKLLEELKNNHDDKTEFLEVNGAGSSNFSRMADEIAAKVPSGLSLKEMSIYPLERKLKKENLVRFYRGEIYINGETKDYRRFQNWFNTIKALDWVQDIEVVGYQEIDTRHQAEFSLNILLKP